MKKYMKIYLKYYIIIIFIAIMVSSALLIDGLPAAHDVDAHMARAVGMSKALKEGQVPPLIVSNYAEGFGYSWNLFYPPLAPYIMTILKLFVFTYENALKLLIILSMIISGIAMFKLIEELTKKKNISLIGAIIYMCSPYILTDIYIRMALGEILSYAFLPILFLGLHNLFNGNGRKYTLIAIGAVGILLSHNISALFAIGMSAIYVLLNIRKLNNKLIWKKIGVNIVFIVLMVAFFYFPLLQTKSSSEYEAFSYGKMGTIESFKNNTVYLSQILFGKMQDGTSNSLEDSRNIDTEMCMQIGLFIVIPLLFTPFVYKKVSRKDRKNYLLTLIVGLLAIFAATPLFPYDIVPKEIAILQYPWRFLLIATFTLSIIATINISKIFEKTRMQEVMILTILILSYITPLIFANTFDSGLKEDRYIGEDEINCTTHFSIATVGLEYLPNNAYENIEYVHNRSQNVIVINGNIEIIEQVKNGSNMNIKFLNGNETASIELPYIYYPGYEIKVDGKKVNYYESENGFIELDVSKNADGEIAVKYTGTKLARITWIISLLSLILFIVYNIVLCLKYHKYRKKVKHRNIKLLNEQYKV